MILFKLILESLRQAFHALRANKLRTFLSLLGIMIGIYSIIVVKSAVDSFQDSILNGFSELGSDVIYLDKQPWNDHGESWWLFAKRPEPSLDDYKAINKKSKKAVAASFTAFMGGKTIKFKSSSVENAFIMGISPEYQQVQALQIEKGRYFSPLEEANARDVVVLGHAVANALFENEDPIGKQVKLMGKKYLVSGILKEEGESMFNFIDLDEAIILSLSNLRRVVSIENGNVGVMLQVKADLAYSLEEVKDEVTGIIRSSRKLKPREESNFALNEITMLNQMLEKIFWNVNVAGLFIGIFSLIVGMVSVANIMFVSVKERTSMIGVKMALGAKRSIILLEFLVEAIILCLIGGVIGIFLVQLTLKLISTVAPLDLYMSTFNLLLGLGFSIAVGILAGIIPAYNAAQLDPVEAIRS